MQEVNRRLCMARATIQNMTPIWKSQAVSKSLKGQNESFLYFSICSCSNIVNYALDNFAEFEKRNRAVNDSN